MLATQPAKELPLLSLGGFSTSYLLFFCLLLAFYQVGFYELKSANESVSHSNFDSQVMREQLVTSLENNETNVTLSMNI